jgi:hypothetical protein
LSREKVPDRGVVEMKGTGFTPKASIISHMKRPDQTEFPGLRILTDDKGEFTHKIDTLTLLIGTHEVWVVDRSGVSSNVAKFEVLPDKASP